MKKNYLLIILILLLLGLASGFYFLSQQEEKRATKGGYTLIASFPLEKIAAGKISTMKFIKGEIKVDPQLNYAVIGTEKGYLRLLDMIEKKFVWEKDLGLGTINALEFSSDGKKVLVGENSPDGYLYCLSIPEGKMLWKVRTAQELGVNVREKSLPQVSKIAVKNDKVYVATTRSEKKEGKGQYTSRLYCLRISDGQKLWTFPAQTNADANINWVSVSTGEKVAIGTMNYTNKGIQYNSLVYCLTQNNGKLLWEKKIKPIHPYKITTVRYGPNFSPDGKKLTLFTSDGRAFCLSDKGDLMWQEAISTPKNIDDFYLGASGRYSYPLKEKIIFTTMNTTNVLNKNEEPPIEHPNSDSLFFYDYQGKLKNKFSAQGAIGELSFSEDKKLALVPVGRNVRTADTTVHGLYLFAEGKNIYHYSSKGPIIAASLSADGEYIAALEAPVILDDQATVLGKYQVLLLQRL